MQAASALRGEMAALMINDPTPFALTRRFGLAVTMGKKNVPPGRCARRQSGMNADMCAKGRQVNDLPYLL